MDGKTPLEEFKVNLRTITIFGIKVYIKEWHDNIVETYGAPTELWYKIDPEINHFNKVIDAYIDDSTIPRKIKITKQRRPLSIFTVGDTEVFNFVYAKKLFYIYILPGE